MQAQTSAPKKLDFVRIAVWGFAAIIIILALLFYLVKFNVIGPNKGRIDKALTELTVGMCNNGLKMYLTMQEKLPGEGSPVNPADPASNVISQVYKALCGKYVDFSEKTIGVIDPATGKARQATLQEINDATINKVILDEWGQSLIARENRSKKEKAPHMRNKDFMDLYSVGPNGVDDTVLMKTGQDNDDIGNW